MRKRKFFFHFNKPLSRQRGYPVISLHFADKCHFIRNIVLNVPTHGKIKKRQPVFIVEGYYNDVVIDPDTEIATVS